MMQGIRDRYAHYRYKNTTLVVLSLVLLWYVVDAPVARGFITSIAERGPLGIVVTGFFFTSTFTVGAASFVLFQLVHIFSPLEVAFFGGMGAVIGDVVLFHILKDHIAEEWHPIFEHLSQSHVGKLFHTPFFAWLSPFVGALIIASPLPDEFGISLLGIAKLKTWQFVLISFAMNMLGILAVVGIATIV